MPARDSHLRPAPLPVAVLPKTESRFANFAGHCPQDSLSESIALCFNRPVPMRAACLVALAVASGATVLAARGADDPEAAALAATERAFALLCVEKGVRASFPVYFADDAIGFEPGPVKARETMLARPAPATKPAYTLDWWPEVVKVSRSGDFGWSTGPSHRTPDPGAAGVPAAFDGHYFSIWKKQTDKTWKVSLDIGLACPLGSIAPARRARLVRPAGSKTKSVAKGRRRRRARTLYAGRAALC